jgi:hypothetical protein
MNGPAHDAATEPDSMPKAKFSYVGDAALKRLVERFGCPVPFHVVCMRFWGEIVSPLLQTSPIKTIESFGRTAFRPAITANRQMRF